MIKNIIFDFGDIFINLDKEATVRNLLKHGDLRISEQVIFYANTYEKGELSSEEFISFLLKEYPKLTRHLLIEYWNAILLDFPLNRLEFIKDVSKKYRCFLLSNTNEMHIDWIKKDWGMELYNDFKNCFEQFYLSHEINMRKPDVNIYEFVLNKNSLIPSETLFIDDTKDNTDTAIKLGIHTWNLTPKKEDITELFNIKKALF